MCAEPSTTSCTLNDARLSDSTPPAPSPGSRFFIWMGISQTDYASDLFLQTKPFVVYWGLQRSTCSVQKGGVWTSK